VAPATPTERTLATIWQDVLGTGDIGATEKFYESGGDSLSLAEMLTRAERTFQLELPVRLGVQHQTIRDLAREIDRLLGTSGTHDVAAGRVSAERVDHANAAAARLRRKPFFQGALVGLHRLVVPLFARIDVQGAEHLPVDGPLIIAANHVNWLDLPFLLGILGTKVTRFSSAPAFVVAHRWKVLFHQYLKQIGLPVYVRRSEGDGESLRQLLAVLRANGVIVITPEGTFNRGALIQARTGVARLATQAPAPVLPLVLYGQEGALHCWRRLRRAPMYVRIAPPIHLPAGDWSQVQLRQQADSVMEAMAELLPAGYRGVYAGADRSRTS
jgi:1-acyl-sn-glycerol-3-phosphate acyltransferase